MLFGLLYILVVYGPWFIIPAVPLGLATAVTVARVHEPRCLLTIAILTSLVGTLSVAETLLGGGYDVFAGRFWLSVECTEMDVVAVVLGVIALRRLAASISVTLAALAAIFAIAATLIVVTGIHRTIADHLVFGAPWITESPFFANFRNQTRVDVVTVLTPALGMIWFWPTWFVWIRRVGVSRPFLYALTVVTIGVPVIAVVTWILLPGFTNWRPYPLAQILLHEAVVLLTWGLAIAAWRQRPTTPAPRMPGAATLG
jgi:hypothetical protein